MRCLVMLVAVTALLESVDSRAERKTVVTTFSVLEDMAQNVAGDKADVVSIIPPGAEVHEYEPTPRDILKARQADLILWNGFGLERWFEKFYSGLDDVPVAVLTKGIAPIGLNEGPYEGKPNPHSWMSPANAAIYVENIRQALVAIDPANAESYDENAQAYSARLAALDFPIKEKLNKVPEQQRFLVTCEGAFSYLAQHYGFKELYLWAVNSEQEGTPQQIRKVIDQTRKYDVPVTFCESTVNPKAMQQVSAESGARFAGILYVDSLTREDGPAPTYEQMLKYNAELIVRGFHVSP
nr:metal ABC transporter substrate-binding protein [Phytohalomonas tamaricis]